MIRRTTLWICATTLSAALAFAAGQGPATPDPGQVILNRACTVCHAITEITKFKGYYGRDQWADVVRTMRADGLLKVQQGLTTLEELDRVVPPEA